MSTSTRDNPAAASEATPEPGQLRRAADGEVEGQPVDPPGHLESAARASAAAAPNKTLFERLEAFVSRLSTRNNFWHRVTSLIWLPYAFRSGIRMRRMDETTFTATLPFTRFNKNWYNAMAGAALLGNSEIAGGMYVFGVCGGDYTVVCKNLEYRFLRPCFGPAEYRVNPREDVQALVDEGGEFNITIDMDVVQILPTMIGKRVSKESRKDRRKRRKGEVRAAEQSAAQNAGRPDRAERLDRLKKREKRVGRVVVTFHVTPKAHHKAKATRA
ncbi:MAG: hypothetical protein CMJ31_09470 [Phycisphaerae bacterium]|nr:hypothetical protein [Phycisphaerae bacterium]